MPVFYNLNHKARFKVRFVTQSSNLVVNNMNIENEKMLDYLTEENPDAWSDQILKDLMVDFPQNSLELFLNDSEIASEVIVALIVTLGEGKTHSLREFEITPIMSFNLVAFAVGPYIKFPCAPYKDKIPIEFYCQRGSERLMKLNLKRLESLTRGGLQFYEEYLGVEYPFTKYGNLFAPHFSFNAMENPGLVLIHQKNLIDPDDQPNCWTILNRDRMILHEMAHMWMGNLYTMNEWHDIWLKESSAEYFCHKAFHGVLAEPEKYGIFDASFKANDIWINFVVRTCINNRREKMPFHRRSYPLCFKNEDYMESLMDYYGSIVYKKGSTYIRSLNYILGEQKFQQLYQEILKQFSYKTMGHQDFKKILMAITDDSMKTELENWFESHINMKGYPRITVLKKTFSSEENSLIVKGSVRWPKWTKIRCLIVGPDGQQIERPATFGSIFDTKDLTQEPEHEKFEWKFEGINFEPIAFIPNYLYDDYVQCIFDDDSMLGLFDRDTLGIENLSTLTFEYISLYFQTFIDFYGEKIVCADFLIQFMAAILKTKGRYLIERNIAFMETVQDKLLEESGQGIFNE
jgi:hypothetical protein